MAQIGKNLSIYIDGINLACAFKNFDDARETEMLDTTALCVSDGRTFKPGLSTGTLEGSGIWDADTTNQDQIDDVMKAAFANKTVQVVTSSKETLAVGGVAVMAQSAKVQNYSIENQLGQLIMCSVSLQADNGIEYGKWLFSDTDSGSGTNGSSVDNGAASTNGGLFQGHLYLASDSAATNANFKLQGSALGSVWTDIDDESVGANKGAVTFTIAAGTTVPRYLRVVFTATGGKAYGVAAFIRR